MGLENEPRAMQLTNVTLTNYATKAKKKLKENSAVNTKTMSGRRYAQDSICLKDVLRGLGEIFSEDKVDVDEVKSLLRAYKSNPKDWRKYCTWDPARYTRNLLDSGNGKYNVIILCWSEGQGSAIHAHANSHCFVKVMDGQILESMYAWPEDDNEEAPMRMLKKTSVNVDEVSYINDSIGLHRMENPSHTEPTVTLHVYIPAYGECMCFDERSGHRSVCQVVFHSAQDGTIDYGNGKSSAAEGGFDRMND
ncbi:hypothetical protein RvY_04017 [Ramazzottius varieornatus]|uniref:Cysteine dioxygenase n=1 Tax=Ramazzottius varieornatus TaxID=947166 RepID=A0A1D1V062_RAMVA|nr:hypothetical protein RvY_04017 [Ramazzottius varieornatus]